MGNPLSPSIGPGTLLSPNKPTSAHIPHSVLSLMMHRQLLPSSTCNWLHLSSQMFGCSLPCNKESCQLDPFSFPSLWRPDRTETTAVETLRPGFVAFSHCVTQEGPPPTMISSLFLAFLFLALATVATTRADSRCLACGEHALDLQSQRELLLPLAKRSILDKLHLSQRPTLSRPVSRAALRTALQRLHGRPQGALPEADRGQEYEIISFAETGGLLTCRSSSKPDLSRKGKLSSPT